MPLNKETKPNMDMLVLTDSQELIYISSVRTQAVDWKTYREQWMIETGGKSLRARKICASRVASDNDDDLFQYNCAQTNGYYSIGKVIWKRVTVVSWLVGFYGISTFVCYLIPDPFLYK